MQTLTRSKEQIKNRVCRNYTRRPDQSGTGISIFEADQNVCSNHRSLTKLLVDRHDNEFPRGSRVNVGWIPDDLLTKEFSRFSRKDVFWMVSCVLGMMPRHHRTPIQVYEKL